MAEDPELQRIARQKAQLELDKAKKEFEEWQSAEARQRRALEDERAARTAEAATQTAEAEAEAKQLAVESTRKEQAQITFPDLSGLERGSIEQADGPILFASPLAARALSTAAAQVAKDYEATFVNGGAAKSVLVTTDADLAASDAAYWEVRSGLTSLLESATALLEAGRPSARAARLAALPSLIESVVVPIVSLLSAKRAIRTSSLDGNDRLAAVAVASALIKVNRTINVFLDTSRVLPETALSRDRASLDKARGALRVALLKNKSSKAADAKEKVLQHQAVLDAVDAFISAVAIVPDGSARSVFASAQLRECLHSGTPIGHVLVVSGLAGGAEQLIDDRPLLFNDKFSSVASMGVAYHIIDVATGAMKGGGVFSATRSISGTIGSEFNVDSHDL